MLFQEAGQIARGFAGGLRFAFQIARGFQVTFPAKGVAPQPQAGGSLAIGAPAILAGFNHPLRQA
jgi:hypothetical protein